jgi:hypothetical protein
MEVIIAKDIAPQDDSVISDQDSDMQPSDESEAAQDMLPDEIAHDVDLQEAPDIAGEIENDSQAESAEYEPDAVTDVKDASDAPETEIADSADAGSEVKDMSVSPDSADTADSTVIPCTEDPVGSCKSYYLCANACPKDILGVICVSQCKSNLSAAGNEDYQELNTCISQYCSTAQTDEELNACVDSKCKNQYFGCFWGCSYLTCVDLVLSINDCPEDNPETADKDERQECINGCWDNSTTQAQINLNDSLNCNNAQCQICSKSSPTPAEKQQCNTCWSNATYDSCGSFWDKCLPSGSKKCSEISSCTASCKDSKCVQQCIQSGTKTAQNLWDTMINCGKDNCPICQKENPTQEESKQCNDCFNDTLIKTGACYTHAVNCLNDKAES